MNLVDAAIYIATEAHRGDVNKHDGELYIHHPQRIAVNLREAGYSEIYQAVAWLHDVVEDTTWTLQEVVDTLEDMVGYGLGEIASEKIYDALDAMTHRQGETNEDYYRRIARNPIARAVGHYDKGVENFGRNHLIENDPVKQAKLAKKYSLAMNILQGPGPVG